MRNIVKSVLRLLAIKTIERYSPKVVGITGSVGKTTAKEAVFAVLNRKFWTRTNEENFNNEIGTPMTVLGIKPGGSNFNIGLQILKSFWLAYGIGKSKYPEILVLELAADRPGDIKYLTDIVKPQIGIITAIGEVPVHVAFYASPQAVAKEKAKLIEALPAGEGLALLNFDDQTVLDLKEKTKAKVVTFGFSNQADVWISDISYFLSDDNKKIGGLSFKINQANTFIPVRINNFTGIHQLYGVLAATIVGNHFGINLVEIAGALENMKLPHGRMNLLRGIKNTIIIDDTYNASPLAMHAALDTLNDFAKAVQQAGTQNIRKVAILADMKELGKYEIDAHRAVGNFAAEKTDILITVGAAAKLMADSAANQMKTENILSFNTYQEVNDKIQEIIKEGDLILVKGSQSMRMEKVVKEIMAEPELAKELLCRQYGEWRKS
jgi:UDP-N-acetylmuramoyl-tripeptide--D-alanyl-D-alanine ligase